MSDPGRNGSASLPDPAVLRVIRPSVYRLAELQDAFVRQLHYEFTALVPEFARQVADQGQPVCERIASSLLWVAAAERPPSAAADTLRQVGAWNRVDGFTEEQYRSVAHALLRAVRELNDDDWTTTAGSAWISYFQWAMPYLVEGARLVSAEQAAAAREAAPAQAQAVARAEAVARAQDAAVQSRGERPEADIDLESAAALLDQEEEEEDEDVSFGQIMVSMTRNARHDDREAT